MRRNAVARAAVVAVVSSIIGVLAVVPAATAMAADPAADLASARDRWESRHISSYSFKLQTKCNACIGVRGRTQTVRVVAGKPRKLPAHFRPYDTVDELFAIVEDAIANAATVNVRYAAKTGVPTKISIDQSADSIDDEYSIRITSFKAIRK